MWKVSHQNGWTYKFEKTKIIKTKKEPSLWKVNALQFKTRLSTHRLKTRRQFSERLTYNNRPPPPSFRKRIFRYPRIWTWCQILQMITKKKGMMSSFHKCQETPRYNKKYLFINITVSTLCVNCFKEVLIHFLDHRMPSVVFFFVF